MVPEADRAPGLYQRGAPPARPCRTNLSKRRRRNMPRSPGTTSTLWGGPEPQLSDFYHTSGGQRDREIAFRDPGDGRNRPGGLQTR